MMSDPHLDALFVYQCGALDVIAAQRIEREWLTSSTRLVAKPTRSRRKPRFDQHRAWAEEARDARKIA
jgi:hypothetical protein